MPLCLSKPQDNPQPADRGCGLWRCCCRHSRQAVRKARDCQRASSGMFTSARRRTVPAPVMSILPAVTDSGRQWSRQASSTTTSSFRPSSLSVPEKLYALPFPTTNDESAKRRTVGANRYASPVDEQLYESLSIRPPCRLKTCVAYPL